MGRKQMICQCGHKRSKHNYNSNTKCKEYTCECFEFKLNNEKGGST